VLNVICTMLMHGVTMKFSESLFCINLQAQGGFKTHCTMQEQYLMVVKLYLNSKGLHFDLKYLPYFCLICLKLGMLVLC